MRRRRGRLRRPAARAARAARPRAGPAARPVGPDRGRDRARAAPSLLRTSRSLAIVEAQAVCPPRRCVGRGNRRRDTDLLPVAPRRRHDHARRLERRSPSSRRRPTPVAPTPLAVGPQDVAYLSVDQDGDVLDHPVAVRRGLPSRRQRLRVDPAEREPQDDRAARQPGVGLRIRSTARSSSSATATRARACSRSSCRPTAAARTPASEPSETPQATPSDEPTRPAPRHRRRPRRSTRRRHRRRPIGSTARRRPPTSRARRRALATAETVEIARGLEVIDTTAAFAPDGSAFAFTAQPADGSHGPDIYVWTVGETSAVPVTTDHQSVFGSWIGRDIVGSSLGGQRGRHLRRADRDRRPRARMPRSRSPKPARSGVPPSTRTGDTAVYWAGSLAPTEDGAGWQTGRRPARHRSMGRHRGAGPERVAGSPDGSASPAAPTRAHRRRRRTPAIRRDAGDETTIAEGPLTDWDARWDETGTRLAVWVADPDDPSVGKLSLYVVDPFDGSIDLDNAAAPRRACTRRLLARRRPARLGRTAGRRQRRTAACWSLAWTDDGFGQVESAPGDVLLIR